MIEVKDADAFVSENGVMGWQRIRLGAYQARTHTTLIIETQGTKIQIDYADVEKLIDEMD